MRGNKINTGISLPPGTLQRLNSIAATLGTSRNRALEFIIESTEVAQAPVLATRTREMTNHSATNFDRQRTVVGG